MDPLLECAMAKVSDEHAGSGIDKAHPKTLAEKIGDGLKKLVPEKPAQEEPEVAPTIMPPAD